ncbi:MAG: family 10 glycosylhydrolase, partial [Clostridia bacterium]
MKFTTRLTALIVTIAMLTSFLPVFAADSDMPFRGVWVCTVYQMDFPTKSTVNADTLRAMADKVLDDAKNSGMNAVILQVRPMADSFYKSSIFPWSKYISGKQGVAPSDGFDPLAYYIDGAHKRGMQLHAWINPFRIAPNDADFAALTPDHPAKKNPAWVVHHSDGQYYFNPGIPEVRALLAKGVSEIVDNYNVDGIHLDDYFYPDEGFNDTATFKQYGAGFKTPLDWRRDNITKLVSQLRDISHAAGKVFGVSPAGIWANKSSATPDGSDTRGNESYVAHAADTRLWAKNGLVDYICPQLYWNIGFNVADYKILANWWADVVSGTNTKLYIGMADYKTGAKEAADPWHGTSEMQRQLDLNRT